MLRRISVVASVALLTVVGLSLDLSAQGQGGGQDTGGNTQTGIPGVNATGQDTGGTASGGVSGDINSQFQQQTQTGLQENLDAAANTFQDTRQEGGFIGANADSQTDIFGRAGQTGGGNFGGIDMIFRSLANMNQSAGEARGTQNQRRTIRAPLRLGFAVSKPDAEAVANQFEERILQLPVYQEHANVVARLQERTLTLTGTVQTQEERVMVERLALLEPGVYRVNNQLTVVSGNN